MEENNPMHRALKLFLLSLDPFIEENTHVTSSRFKPPPTLFEPEEGNPGEEGSSVARNPGESR